MGFLPDRNRDLDQGGLSSGELTEDQFRGIERAIKEHLVEKLKIGYIRSGINPDSDVCKPENIIVSPEPLKENSLNVQLLGHKCYGIMVCPNPALKASFVAVNEQNKKNHPYLIVRTAINQFAGDLKPWTLLNRHRSIVYDPYSLEDNPVFSADNPYQLAKWINKAVFPEHKIDMGLFPRQISR